MPTNTYDLIVLGDDFAGLVAATLCSRRGMRVLLARTEERKLNYRLGPHRFPVRPLPFVGMASPAVRRVLEELHFDHLLKRRLRVHKPAFQLVGPDARIDVSADDVGLAKELERELDDPDPVRDGCQRASAIAGSLDPVLGQDIAFPPAGFWERREVGRSATRLEEDAEAWFETLADNPFARSLIELPAVMGTHGDPLALSAPARARAFDLWRQGTPRLSGDWHALSEVFLEKFTSHSGELRTVHPEAITYGWSKATGVRLENGEELGANHIIAALPLEELQELAEDKRPKRLAQLAERIEPAGYRCTLNFLVSETGIPAGMAPTALVVCDTSAPLIGDNAFAVYRDEPDDSARVVVTVEAICPVPEPGQALEDALADLRVGLRERLENVMPFFSEHVLLAHSPHETTPAEGASGELALARPFAASPVWKSSIERYLGVSGVPYSVGVKNLTVASSQVLCGLGLEGDFAAGWCAARIACASAGKKRDHLRDDLLVGKG